MRVAEARFELDARLERDSRPLMWLGLCELRVLDDCRWPWLVLIPQRPAVVEFHDLSPLDQTMLTFELDMVSRALKRATGCHKINIGALGNVVSQLHVHIVARNEDDPAWPGPVWGHGPREPYRREGLHRFAGAVRSALSP